MPLHAKAERVRGVFDAFDDTIARAGIDDDPIGHFRHRLVVGAIDRKRCLSDDLIEQRVGNYRHLVPCLVARVGLLVREGVLDAIGDVLDERAT